MVYEYTRFGAGTVRRKAGTADDWEPVPADDMQEAEIEVRIQERQRAARKANPPRHMTARITRGQG